MSGPFAVPARTSYIRSCGVGSTFGDWCLMPPVFRVFQTTAPRIGGTSDQSRSEQQEGADGGGIRVLGGINLLSKLDLPVRCLAGVSGPLRVANLPCPRASRPAATVA